MKLKRVYVDRSGFLFMGDHDPDVQKEKGFDWVPTELVFRMLDNGPDDHEDISPDLLERIFAEDETREGPIRKILDNAIEITKGGIQVVSQDVIMDICARLVSLNSSYQSDRKRWAGIAKRLMQDRNDVIDLLATFVAMKVDNDSLEKAKVILKKAGKIP